jgi:V8-like Glu-specific endopeptidase
MTDWENFNSSFLIEVTRSHGIFTCSGVAINSTTILTAAHCLDGDDILKVRISNQAEYDPNAHFYEVDSFQIHPDYNPKESFYKNDLAKIQLSNPLPIQTKYYPIIKNNQKMNGSILRIGFGGRNKRNIRTLITPVLREIRHLEKVVELHDIYSYSGDSGGPIFLQRDGQMYLIAIHSTLSFGPEGKFSYNPLLSSHCIWINS